MIAIFFMVLSSIYAVIYLLAITALLSQKNHHLSLDPVGATAFIVAVSYIITYFIV